MQYLLLISVILGMFQASEGDPERSDSKGVSGHPSEEVMLCPSEPEDRETAPRDTLRTAVVSGSRPLGQAGISRTEIDSIALKENISLSLAGLLAYNSSVFIKQYGRATLSTVSLRGTASSHTQVLWNGMKISSPMLGMADFSLIPAYFADRAEILHGPSSLQETGGGTGGAVILESRLPDNPGAEVQYIQGFGSFLTADEFLRVSYKVRHFSTSTRLLLSTSKNDFSFVNMDKKEISYDGNMEIADSWHPVEKNRNGEFRDFHVMQELGYDLGNGNALTFSAWYMDSWRQIPPVSVDYGTTDIINEQKESALRVVAGWTAERDAGKTEISAGCSLSELGYDNARDNGNGDWSWLTRAVSRTGTFMLKGKYSLYFAGKWMLATDVSAYFHSITSEDRSSLVPEGKGYDVSAAEVSAAVSVKWQPVRRIGLSATLREEFFDRDFSPPVPAVNADFLVSRSWQLYLKGSASLNYRHPSLNDLYYVPGGNPDLGPESGFCYDAGYSLSKRIGRDMEVEAGGYWFDSMIDGWILWLPEGARKNFWTPVNMMKVHAFGVEQRVGTQWRFADGWNFRFNGNFTWSRSLDSSPSENVSDSSYGKQLPYIPEYSGSFTASLTWKNWSLLWKWCWYSTRYVMTSNEKTVSGSVPPYFMNDISIGKKLDFRRVGLSVLLNIDNLFNERYVTVLSRPMPGINYEIYIGITPKFKRK